MKMKNILIILSLYSTFAYSEDLIQCNGNCNNKCDGGEKISLNAIEADANLLLKKFELSPLNKESPKQFMENISRDLSSLMISKTSLSEKCLDNYCSISAKKNLKVDLGNGLSLSFTNPICDYSQLNRNQPVNFLMVSLSNEVGSLAQISFKSTDLSLSVMLKPSSKKCSENEAGTFNNNFVVSLNSLAVIPNDSSTVVKNTPVGAQLIRKKKSLTKISLNSNGNINFNFGDNFNAVIDPKNNTMISDNLLINNCKGSVIRNSASGSSRISINLNSLNNNQDFKVFDSNKYKIIDAETSKVPW
jgi:hypothetical protein